jgi:hypothetical protein
MTSPSQIPAASKDPAAPESAEPDKPMADTPVKPEHGGPKGPEPTRYGDWERNGRCFDF